MLSKLKFIGKILSNIIPGRERFFPKYLYEYELKHITLFFFYERFFGEADKEKINLITGKNSVFLCGKGY